MKKLKAIYKNFNMPIISRNRILFMYILFILIPGSMMMYSYFSKTSDITQQEVANATLQALKQADVYISYRMEMAENISNTLFANATLQSLLSKKGNKVMEDYSEKKTLEGIIGDIQSNNNVDRIRLYINDNKLYANERVNFFPLKDIENEDWYPAVLNAGGKIYWRRTYKEETIGGGTKNFLSCVRVIRNLKDFKDILAVMSIDIEESSIFDAINKIELQGNKSVFIMDDTGNIISHKDKSLIGNPIDNKDEYELSSNRSEGIYSYGQGQDKTYVIYKNIELTGWKIIAQIPVKEMEGQTGALYNAATFTIVTLCIFIFSVFLVIAILIDITLRRMREMVSSMETEGVNPVSGNNHHKGELRRLKNGIENMIDAVKKLTKESYQAKVNEREAQLKALQAQINPHFLYNTLDTINWMAIKRNADEISSMVESLASYFRLSLNKGKNIVSIQDEINLAKVYFEIQKHRFVNSFVIEYDIEQEVYQYNIPKLSLQPIVENALIHGISNKDDRKGKITISARKVEEDIIVAVSDDGVGMDEEKMKILMTPPQQQNITTPGRSGYGLYNVNERIKLFSGENNEGYGIKIISEIEVGTRVEIRVRCNCDKL